MSKAKTSTTPLAVRSNDGLSWLCGIGVAQCRTVFPCPRNNFVPLFRPIHSDGFKPRGFSSYSRALGLGQHTQNTFHAVLWEERGGRPITASGCRDIVHCPFRVHSRIISWAVCGLILVAPVRLRARPPPP